MSEVVLSEETKARLEALNVSIAEQMKKLQDEMVREGGELLKRATLEIFDSYPQLYGFSWEQYTPYWNDGDTCEFGVRADYSLGIYQIPFTQESKPNKDDDGAYKYDYEFGSEWSLEHYDEYAARYSVEDPYPPKWKFEAGNIISNLVMSIPEETLKTLFGDHAEVYVTRDEVWTEECEHG